MISALFVLALIDLSVGVSNDAVNFLNSAIGSRVAKRRTILFVATCGIILGAMFSSGIMEVARKGVFNPEMFTFSQVMVIFVAVMIADVILLDLFNTFGMPTSTTVSIVFELLGSATVVAILYTLETPGASPVLEFINVRNALAIVFGIALSVVIAFVTGTVVQFFSRLLFTFQDTRFRPLAVMLWSAVALTIISYFLFIKGLKGAGFVTPPVQEFVSDNTGVFLALLFITWLSVALLLRRLGFNPLVFVVLAGTFSLAMAFASNDLVNFIGVPLAGLESWKAWAGTGIPADQFTMDILREPVTSSSFYLLGAGIIMAVTLWMSAKSRSVTQTEVNLARQHEGAERFQPGLASRVLVRLFIGLGATFRALTPQTWREVINKRFSPYAASINQANVPPPPAFDLVRASVNLAVASILIALATSMKLPLSTTFVSFMVAMGTSLADRAWGRESAVYRVAGVLNVLAGWFATACIAFLMAGIFALLLSLFGGAALAGSLVLVVIVLYRSFQYHGTRTESENQGLQGSAIS